MKSKLQLSVLQLYRDFLKFGRRFSDPTKLNEYRAKVREQFEEDRTIQRRKFNAIEYRVRAGKNLLRSMEEGQVSQVNSIRI